MENTTKRVTMTSEVIDVVHPAAQDGPGRPRQHPTEATVTNRVQGVTSEQPSAEVPCSGSIEAQTHAPPSRGAMIGYWVLTLFVAIPALMAGAMDVLHVQPLFGLLLHLGYPAYFATILGVWKVVGAIVLLAPRYPLIKEWAYAGMVIDYSSAVLSHAASGDGAGAIAGPALSLVALAASWYLRPRSRRLP